MTHLFNKEKQWIADNYPQYTGYDIDMMATSFTISGPWEQVKKALSEKLEGHFFDDYQVLNEDDLSEVIQDVNTPKGSAFVTLVKGEHRVGLLIPAKTLEDEGPTQCSNHSSVTLDDHLQDIRQAWALGTRIEGSNDGENWTVWEDPIALDLTSYKHWRKELNVLEQPIASPQWEAMYWDSVLRKVLFAVGDSEEEVLNITNQEHCRLISDISFHVRVVPPIK